MWRVTTDDGRVAWFCEDDREQLDAMVAELFDPATNPTIRDERP